MVFEHLGDAALTARLRAIEAQQRALDVERIAVLGEWDRRGAWADDGSLSAAARLARETDIGKASARERMRVAARLRDAMPATFAAAEELGWPKVRLLVGVINDRTIETFTEHEELLVAKARELSVDQLSVFLRAWAWLVDQDGANADIDAMLERSFVQLTESFAGEGFLKGRLDPETRVIVQSVLDLIANELFHEESQEITEAKLRGEELPRLRSAGQRYAAALREMAVRARATTEAAASGAPVAPARPLVTVVIDADAAGDVMARFADGTPVPTEDAVRMACDAAVARLLTDRGNVPLDLGRTVREPSEAQRRALGALWSGCAYPGCDRPFAWCQLHHVVHWEHGGETNVGLLVPLCGRHHRQHHRGVFDVQPHRCRDGTFVFTRHDGALIGDANPTLSRLVLDARSIFGAAAATAQAA